MRGSTIKKTTGQTQSSLNIRQTQTRRFNNQSASPLGQRASRARAKPQGFFNKGVPSPSGKKSQGNRGKKSVSKEPSPTNLKAKPTDRKVKMFNSGSTLQTSKQRSIGQNQPAQSPTINKRRSISNMNRSVTPRQQRPVLNKAIGARTSGQTPIRGRGQTPLRSSKSKRSLSVLNERSQHREQMTPAEESPSRLSKIKSQLELDTAKKYKLDARRPSQDSSRHLDFGSRRGSDLSIGSRKRGPAAATPKKMRATTPRRTLKATTPRREIPADAIFSSNQKPSSTT